ncbi:DUF916 and DUF3324 domain-containing protein [Lacticaseibacillus suilingensis]|uniref:DUF916 and DUF3324 domain-containing protein n=1 Tax=Lacticaseibacillus suilingensis TaxID=2799577 RepID=A0ABW4BEH0_9LACO|nr:DUF916 and DUF3324 domain-containing protein [Lacticaseibacillus suilingensis]
MKRRTRLLMALFAIILGTSGFGVKVHAQDNPGDFGVKAILPSNQIDPAITYFDLLVKPGQTQTVSFAVSNAAKKTRKFALSVNPAVTSDGGTIDYSQAHPTLDPTLPFDPRAVMQLDQNSVTLKAGETQTIALRLKLPAKAFQGQVLAGIHVEPIAAKPQAKAGKAGARIINRYAYNVAIVLQENRAAVPPMLKLRGGKIAPVNSRPTVQLRFQNPAPTIIGDLVFKTKLYKNGKPFMTDHSNAYLVAPNSHFNLNLALDNHRATAGRYQAVIHATAKGGHKWSFTQSFTVSPTQASQVNRRSVFIEQPAAFGPMAIVLAVLLVLALFVIILLLWRNRRKQTGGTTDEK